MTSAIGSSTSVFRTPLSAPAQGQGPREAQATEQEETLRASGESRQQSEERIQFTLPSDLEQQSQGAELRNRGSFVDIRI